MAQLLVLTAEEWRWILGHSGISELTRRTQLNPLLTLPITELFSTPLALSIHYSSLCNKEAEQ
ncbi:hypothetical protein E2C01_029161 [Portunus trituberculatus]|uniref:Uncharacterized protein n=1 Tax=Portunus trituberculatus TaxID=210409 RepID=A0A5B7ER44_PORTR|nr:hypothetical protein [Portunus trituberculatus]